MCYTATYFTSSNTHSNTLGLSLLLCCISWNLAFPGHTRHLCWTNKIIPNHNLWDGFVQINKKIKWLSLAVKAKLRQLFAAHSKCGISWVNLKTLTITQIIACSFLSSSIFLNYAIRIKTLSPHNQTSVTKEWMGLSTGIVVYAGLWLTGPQGEIGGRPQKSSAASGTKNPRATYCTWLTMGYGKTPEWEHRVCAFICVCLSLCICVIIKQPSAYCWGCVVKHVSLSSKHP